MTTELPPTPLHADIRSPSIPRQRFATHRAKYGPQPPTSTGHPYTLPVSGLTFNPSTGSFDRPTNHSTRPTKPTTHFTKRQTYLVARNNVPEFVGKHVNRNNQRTGERDPWNYYGPRRRWERAERSGRREASGGKNDYWMQMVVDSDLEDSFMRAAGEFESSGGVEIEADEVWGQRYDDRIVLKVVEDGRGRRRRSMGEWKVVRREDVEERWTEGLGEGEGKGETETEQQEEDEWEVVSVSSAPG